MDTAVTPCGGGQMTMRAVDLLDVHSRQRHHIPPENDGSCLSQAFLPWHAKYHSKGIELERGIVMTVLILDLPNAFDNQIPPAVCISKWYIFSTLLGTKVPSIAHRPARQIAPRPRLYWR